MERTIERTPDEVTEIERHKYFLSEKAGYDVGWEAAEQDWDQKHAVEFRAARRKEETQLKHGAHDGPYVQRGGLRMLFHRMFSRDR